MNYAQSLGLSPHRDFEATRNFLGEWDGEPALTFGKEGKPYFVNGPYDNVNKILRTLEDKVGKGNFEYNLIG